MGSDVAGYSGPPAAYFTAASLLLPGVSSLPPPTLAALALATAAALRIDPAFLSVASSPGDVSAVLLFAASNASAWGPSASAAAASYFASALFLPQSVNVSLGTASPAPGGFAAVPLRLSNFSSFEAEASAAAGIAAAATAPQLATLLSVAGFGASASLGAAAPSAATAGVASSAMFPVSLLPAGGEAAAMAGGGGGMGVAAAAAGAAAAVLGTPALPAAALPPPPPPPVPSLAPFALPPPFLPPCAFGGNATSRNATNASAVNATLFGAWDACATPPPGSAAPPVNATHGKWASV